jgi:NAD dependent epimerase/dehydratase family enzyme
MRIVIAGASGLIGTQLAASLSSAGHDVVALVRRAPASASEIRWDPASGRLDPEALAGADTVVNLSGAGIGDRPWTRRRIGELFTSRLEATRALTGAMRRLDDPPRTFVSQSASG